MATKLIINCTTGEREYIDLTPEEEAEILVRQAAVEQQEIADQLRALGIEVV